MSTKIEFLKSSAKLNGTIILSAFEETGLSAQAEKFDKTLNGLIASTLKNNAGFAAKHGEILQLPLTSEHGFSEIIVLGLGKTEDLNDLKAEAAGGKLYTILEKSGYEHSTIIIDRSKKLKGEVLAAHLANGLKLRSYKFDRYKSKKKGPTRKKPFKTLKVLAPHPENAKITFGNLNHTTEGTFFTRDLVNTPPNDLYPQSFAKLLQSDLKPLGVDIEIFDDKKLEKIGMGGIMAVGKGSERKPRMVVMRWNGGSKKEGVQPLGFVGKGVTFDTGGISIKPAAGMDEMKMDMGGSAALAGLMKTLALRKAKCNVVAIVGLAENMPSSNAYRPGDIIKSYAGKTIEILNTDAEGRLVLADCLTYIQQEYNPSFVIDLATLTGAIMVALGHEYCGTFVNDDTLWKQLEKSSENSGEKLWRMPLDKVWKKDMESETADIQNLGKSGRWAGACTAAGFLEHFIEKDVQWAHMDIAGTAWRKTDKPTTPKYASGFGVRVLNELIKKYYEN